MMRAWWSLIGSTMAVAALGACGDDGTGGGGDGMGGAATGGFSTGGLGTGGLSTGGLGTGGLGTGGGTGCVTFADMNAQIFVPHCLSCHSGGFPSGEMSLETQAVAEAKADSIAELIALGQMPDRAPPLSSDLATLAANWASCIP